MNALKEARLYMQRVPHAEGARTLGQLVLALESAEDFPLEKLYALDLKEFEIAIDILKEWRLDRYYARKLKLFDVSTQVRDINSN